MPDCLSNASKYFDDRQWKLTARRLGCAQRRLQGRCVRVGVGAGSRFASCLPADAPIRSATRRYRPLTNSFAKSAAAISQSGKPRESRGFRVGRRALNRLNSKSAHVKRRNGRSSKQNGGRLRRNGRRLRGSVKSKNRNLLMRSRQILTCRRCASNSMQPKRQQSDGQRTSVPKKSGNVKKRRLLNEPGVNAKKLASV